MNALIAGLETRADYTTFAAFRTIDRYQEGHINVSNLQEFFRAFGNYLVEQEVFAVIRRVDTDGDARLSYEEFADFFKTQANVQAPLMGKGPSNPNGYSSAASNSSKASQSKKKKEYPGGDRGYLFATDSKLGANIERSIN